MIRCEDELGTNANAELDSENTDMRLATKKAAANFLPLLASLFIVAFLCFNFYSDFYSGPGPMLIGLGEMAALAWFAGGWLLVAGNW